MKMAAHRDDKVEGLRVITDWTVGPELLVRWSDDRP